MTIVMLILYSGLWKILIASLPKYTDSMRLLIDLVPNHSSSEHEWFVESRSSMDSDKRGFYHWRDPSQNGGPPNNWVSHFGGSVWTFDELTEQYYLHLFLPEQPDLNWNNPNVVKEFDNILRFWLARDVDGFRIDVAQGLVKICLWLTIRFGSLCIKT